jgi:Cytosol aminopeptidase family, N-terminal domain
MELSYYPLTMEALDQADAEALCLFVSEDERPLTGLAGLVDWRLSGRLSRMIRAGLVIGAAGEALLTPPGMRLAFKKLFVFGLGSARTDDELAARLADALRRLAQAGVKDAALQLPARLAPERGVQTLMDGDGAIARALVFTPEPAKLVTSLSQSSGTSQVERRVVKVPSPPKASPPPRTRQKPTPASGSPPVPPAAAAATPPASEAAQTGDAPAPRPLPPRPQRYVPPPPKEAGPKKKRH